MILLCVPPNEYSNVPYTVANVHSAVANVWSAVLHVRSIAANVLATVLHVILLQLKRIHCYCDMLATKERGVGERVM